MKFTAFVITASAACLLTFSAATHRDDPGWMFAAITMWAATLFNAISVGRTGGPP